MFHSEYLFHSTDLHSIIYLLQEILQFITFQVMSETLCKFYQQGNCRFGNNCKFSHSANKTSSYNKFADPNRFSYVNPEEKLKQKMKQRVGSAESIAEIIMNDFKNWLPSNVWPFSCYSVNSLENIFPELNDLSTEEARYAYLSALNSGSTERHIQEISAAGRKAEEFIASVAKANKEELLVLIRQKLGSEDSNIMSNSVSDNPFGPTHVQSNFGSQNSSVNPFMNKAANSSVFSSQPSFPPSHQHSSNTFGSSSENIFASNSSSSSSGTFTRTSNSSDSMFSSNQNFTQAPDNHANPFISNTNQNFPKESSSDKPAFGNVFAQPEAGQSVFGKTDIQNSGLSQFNSGQNNSMFGEPKQLQNTTGFGNSTSSINNSLVVHNSMGQFLLPQQTSPGISIGENVLDKTCLSIDLGNKKVNSDSSNAENSLVNSIKSESVNPFSTDKTVCDTQTYLEDMSRIPKLSEKDLIQYKSRIFEWGQIPECPPPPELCT